MILAAVALAPAVAAAPPVVFFSDLDWGPKTGWEGSATKGAAVSIWGLNFGSLRGSSYVTVNGAQLTADSDYAEWGVISTTRSMQRTTFWLKPSCSDGNGTISVTVGGVTSSTIPFRVAAGAIYFISPSGSDSNAGTTTATAWRNALKFNPAKNPSGDGQYIVYARSGSYTAFDSESAFVALRGPYGSDTKRKALVGYPGETPTFTVTSSSRGLIWPANYDPYGRNDYFTFAKLRVVGGTQAFGLWGDYYRVVGNSMEDMRTDSWTGVVMVDNSQQVQVLGNLFKNCGYDSYKHNIYIKTHPNYISGDKSIDYVTVGWNEFDSPYAGSDNRGGAIFVSRASDSGSKTVDHVYIHSNYFHGGNMEFIYTGDTTPHNGDIWIYNNVLCDNTNGAGGMYFAWGTRNVYLYNNTFYGLKGQGMVAITGTAQVISRNNVFRSTGTANLSIETYQGGTFNSQNDLYHGAAAPSGSGVTISAAKSGDPLFVSATDFDLASSSPARDAGSSSVASTVSRSYDGVNRPQGSVIDIGAFEYDMGQAASTQVSVTPSSVDVGEGQQQQFTAAVTGSTNQAVTWSMNPVLGTLSASGLYTAPVAISTLTPVTITATSQADTTASGTATATLTPPFGVTLSMSPATVSLNATQTRQFTVTASGGTMPALTWTRTPAVGTVVNGLYTAPATVTSSQQVTVTATSTTDTAVKASAVVTLNPAATVTLSISPATVSLGQGQTRQFAVTAAGGTLPALAWTLSPAVGTISTAGLYTAPASVTTSQQVTVTATSTANSTIKTSAVVTLTPTTAVTLSISPTAVSLGQGQTRQFTVTASGGTLPALTWTRSPAVGTVVNGLYTAPSTVTTSQQVVVTATSTANSAIKASAVVTLTQPAAVTLSINPASCNLGQGQSRQLTVTASSGTLPALTWTRSPAVGTVVNGLYTAPPSVTTSQQVVVTATSTVNSAIKTSSVVTITPAASAISVTVTPGTATLIQWWGRQFKATVAGTTTTGVTWSISPQVGTITSAGYYKPPSSIKTTQTVTIRATSTADPTKYGTAVVTLKPLGSYF